MRKLFSGAVLFVLVMVSSAYGEDPDLAKLFTDRNVYGTIVIQSQDGGKTYIHNDQRANRRFIPASTFKIPNTLIALEEGAISDEKEIIKWDGNDKGLPAWNKDQSIETAFPSSCVWYYQKLAERVGKDKYKSWLQKIKYGNEQAGPDLTTFWLEGDLRISAVEQIAFLKNLCAKQYPFRSSSFELLGRVMLVERTSAYAMWGKTGWAQRVVPQVGWFVGYVEAGGKVWFFATNMEIAKPEDAGLRRQITMEALKLKGII
jgi:beta-lactamase class D